MNASHGLTVCGQLFQALSLPIRKTVAAAATALIGSQVVGVSALGRELKGRAQPNSGVKRIERLITNRRFDVLAACSGLIAKVIRRNRRVFVCMDWTDQGNFQRLELAVATGSRTIPIFWRVVSKTIFSAGESSQNKFEEEFIKEFISLLPRGAQVVLLADRGFGRTEFFRFLSSCDGLEYVIRVKGDTWIRNSNGTLRMKEQRVPPGQVWDLGLVAYRDIEDAEHAVQVRGVIAFGMAAEEPWYLVTNLHDEALQVAGAYARRFEIEETFRNQKDLRFGFGLRLVRLKEGIRYERLLVVVAVACLIAFGVGVHAENVGLHRQFQVNTRTVRQHNLITLGCYWFDSVRLTTIGLMTAVVSAILRRVEAFDGVVSQGVLAQRARPPRRRSEAPEGPPTPASTESQQAPAPRKRPETEDEAKHKMGILRMLAVG